MSYGGIAGQKPEELEQELKAHVDNKNNPHGVTKEQLGLGNVETWELIGEQNFDILRERPSTIVRINASEDIAYSQVKLKVSVVKDIGSHSPVNLRQNSVVIMQIANDLYVNVPKDFFAMVVYDVRYDSAINNENKSSFLNGSGGKIDYSNKQYQIMFDNTSQTALDPTDKVTFKAQLYGQK